MDSFLRFFCCFVLLCLSSCATHQHNVNKSELTQCLQVCMQHLDYCKQNCTNNCPSCSASANKKAADDFLVYLHEKQVQGGYVNRRLKSYRDPLQCRKVTCSCSADYDTCKQGCTGVIQKRLKALPYCT